MPKIPMPARAVPPSELDLTLAVALAVETESVTAWLVVPVGTVEGEKVQVLWAGNPVHAKETAVARGTPGAAARLNW
jgi:hypothetical protein